VAAAAAQTVAEAAVVRAGGLFAAGEPMLASAAAPAGRRNYRWAVREDGKLACEIGERERPCWSGDAWAPLPI
jgi:hypothetical protein